MTWMSNEKQQTRHEQQRLDSKNKTKSFVAGVSFDLMPTRESQVTCTHIDDENPMMEEVFRQFP